MTNPSFQKWLNLWSVVLMVVLMGPIGIISFVPKNTPYTPKGQFSNVSESINLNKAQINPRSLSFV